ncbi:MAG: hypothetical protein S4CHLAM2_17560 [Chlamydiales bacterium]|nr:hypothetical protein [Chlamydiales bacterium]
MRFDLVLSNRQSYSYEGYTARQLAAALEKKKITYKCIYLSDGILNEYIRYVEEDPPTSMVCFSDHFALERPFCDIVRVPQLFWVQHSLAEAAHFVHSDFGKIGLPEPSTLPNTVYLPHGVTSDPPLEPVFDTVFFSPLIDLDDLKRMWEDFYPKEVLEKLKRAIASDLPPYEAASAVVDHPAELTLLFQGVCSYKKAVFAHHAITSFEGERLDVFGEHMGNNWLKRLPNASKVHLHYKLPYTEHLEVLKQSRAVILDPLEPHWAAPAQAFGCTLQGVVPQTLELYSWERQTEKLIEVAK